MLMLRRTFTILTMSIIWKADADSNVQDIIKNKIDQISNFEIPAKVILSVEPIKNFILTIPEHCELTGICEDIPNYPYEEVSAIIEKLLILNKTLNMDTKRESNIEIPIEEEEQLCKESSMFYRPQAARRVNQEWNLILNSEQTHQNFFGNECEGASGSCSFVTISNYDTLCSQKYMGRTMYGLNKELDTVIKTIYEVPSCCVCVGKKRNN